MSTSEQPNDVKRVAPQSPDSPVKSIGDCLDWKLRYVLVRDSYSSFFNLPPQPLSATYSFLDGRNSDANYRIILGPNAVCIKRIERKRIAVAHLFLRSSAPTDAIEAATASRGTSEGSQQCYCVLKGAPFR